MIRRAATPLKDISHLYHPPNFAEDDEDDQYDQDDTSDPNKNQNEQIDQDDLYQVEIPTPVFELSAPYYDYQLSTSTPTTNNEPRTHNGNQSGSVSIHVNDECAQNGNGNKVLARKQSDDNDTSWAKFRKKSSPVVNASVVMMYLVMSSMFVFGWISLNRCTVNPLIPVYLIVAGSTGILTKALIRTRNKYLFNVVILLVLFDLCWQAFGSYIVYREYQPNYEENNNGPPYCYRVAYLLAFWIITMVYSLIGMFILLSCCYFMMRNTFRKA